MTYMTEEEKAAQEAKEAEEEAAKAEETKATEDETTEEEESEEGAESDEESKQLEAELQKEREAREKAEKALAERRFKSSEKKREEKDSDDDGESEEDKPMTRKEFEAALAKQDEKTRKEMLHASAERIAEGLSGSEIEKQLVLEKWKNRTFPAHLSLEEQIEECYAIANRKKIIGERNEALRALKGKQGANKGAAGTHHDAPAGTAPKIAGSDAAELARVGFKYNTTAKRYEKKLPNGKLLVKKDLKSPAQMA